jgi:hypothetical protein
VLKTFSITQNFSGLYAVSFADAGAVAAFWAKKVLRAGRFRPLGGFAIVVNPLFSTLSYLTEAKLA